MITIYLWANAAIYGLFAVWCTVASHSTSQNLGFLSLSSSGKSEYLTIYGGLQAGMALFFAFTALKPAMQASGLYFAVFLYSGIVLYRMITVIAFRPVSSLTMMVAGLELILLISGALLLRNRVS